MFEEGKLRWETWCDLSISQEALSDLPLSEIIQRAKKEALFTGMVM